MKQWIVCAAVFVLGTGALLVACSGSKTCSPANCDTCCDSNGDCRAGTTIDACGAAGSVCQVCAPTQFCSAGSCISTGGGGGGGGSDGGGSDGGGSGDGGGGLDGGFSDGGSGDAGLDGGADAGCAPGTNFSTDPENCGGCGKKCPYRSICSNGACMDDFNSATRPYCVACTGQTCGSGNYCVSGADGGSFCGVDCSNQKLCPSGYFCKPLRVATPVQCVGGMCPSHSEFPCTTSADCPKGGSCLGGLCTPPCDTTFATPRCACLSDADCVQESCVGGKCNIRGTACASNTDCAPIHCVQGSNGGECRVADNCVPTPPLTCADVGTP